MAFAGLAYGTLLLTDGSELTLANGSFVIEGAASADRSAAVVMFDTGDDDEDDDDGGTRLGSAEGWPLC